MNLFSLAFNNGRFMLEMPGVLLRYLLGFSLIEVVVLRSVLFRNREEAAMSNKNRVHGIENDVRHKRAHQDPQIINRMEYCFMHPQRCRQLLARTEAPLYRIETIRS